MERQKGEGVKKRGRRPFLAYFDPSFVIGKWGETADSIVLTFLKLFLDVLFEPLFAVGSLAYHSLCVGQASVATVSFSLGRPNVNLFGEGFAAEGTGFL